MWPKFLMTLAISWYPFMCIHELGHCISAKINRGSIESVTLVPWRFSQTVIRDSRNPLMDAWMGPVIGVILPLLIWLICKKHPKMDFYSTLFAGFCLLANGLYIGIGWIDKIGDCGDILKHQGNTPSMLFFGILTVIPGFLLWHRALENYRKENAKTSNNQVEGS